ncbi:hypothetical protein AB0F46_29440 [Streptomyces sp. NPDC026665]|uniref:hypothetical protein n=1 Tax=Streptomyces sp. NPDC026665 TaxID=3154798 RepID=UPI0033E41AA5
MIGDLFTVLRALVLWIVIGAAAITVAGVALVYLGAAAWRVVRRGSKPPSWARRAHPAAAGSTVAYRRTARTFALSAAIASATSASLITAHPWLAFIPLYIAALLAWAATCYYAVARRHRAEDDWERRHVLGEAPAPLNPCCMLARRSHGAAHDARRCTDTFHRLTAHLDPWSSS